MCFANAELAAMCRHVRDAALGLVDITYPDTHLRRQPDANDAERRRLFSAVESEQDSCLRFLTSDWKCLQLFNKPYMKSTAECIFARLASGR